MAIEHTGILQVHVSVTDLERSVTFYRDVLGLRHLFTVQAQPMAFFDAGGIRLYLAIPEDERFRSRPVIYYGVADLDDAFDTAVSRGAVGIAGPQLVYTDDEKRTELWMAFVQDPDGTPIGLTQERAELSGRG
ncbi:MAG: VOC family protein [Actinomycetota bacterium]|nr:VOC family protein [Actinomycetota bacterium]